jgi:prepilin-type N-terminal cleavage/methylation domain-containing protein
MSRTCRRHSGFTLIELLVSMAIGTIVLLMAVMVLGRTSDGYDRIGGAISAEREARAALGQLSSDLSAARYQADQVFESNGSGWMKDDIGFLALQSADSQSTAGRIGDVCAIHYYMKDLLANGRSVRCLMRGFRESSDTFDALKSGDISPLFAPRSEDEPIAFGVISFQAKPQSRDASGNWHTWEKSSGQAPQAVALKLILTRKQLSAKLTSPADWDGDGAARKLLGNPEDAINNPELQTFGSLIRFGNDEAR